MRRLWVAKEKSTENHKRKSEQLIIIAKQKDERVN
jgi:hypothetical protein